MSTPDAARFSEVQLPATARYREPKYTVGKAMTYALSLAVAGLTLKTVMASRSNVPPAPVAHVAARAVVKAEAPEETPHAVSAETMFAEYKANQAQADARYKDHALEVDGQVQSVYQDSFGNAVVVLRTSDPLHGVRASLRSEGRRTTGMKRGDPVRMVCRGGDRMMGSPTLTGCAVE